MDMRQDSLRRLGQAGAQEYGQGREGAGGRGTGAWAPMHRGQAAERPGQEAESESPGYI